MAQKPQSKGAMATTHETTRPQRSPRCGGAVALVTEFTRTVLASWDHQGKQARERLISFLDEVENDVEEGLMLPRKSLARFSG
jgi:hypothetical protein